MQPQTPMDHSAARAALPAAEQAALPGGRWPSTACLVAAALAGLLALTLIAAGLVTTVHRAVLIHLNSDLLYIAAVYRDLGGNLARWNLPPAPYFFPDMALTFPLWSLTGELGAGYLLYGVVLFVLFLGGFYALLGAVEGSVRVRLIATLSAALLYLSASRNGHPALGVAFLPIFHAGVLVVGLWFLAATWALLTRPTSFAARAAVFLLAALTGASDLFFVTQFIFPMGLAIVLLGRGKRLAPPAVRTWLVTILLAGAVAIAGLIVFQRITAVRFHSNFVLESLHHLPSLRGLFVIVLATTLAAAAIRWPRRAAQALSVVLIVLLGMAIAQGAALKRLAHTAQLPAGWPLSSLAKFARDMIEFGCASPLLWLCIPIAAGCAAWCSRRAWQRGPQDNAAVFLTLSLLMSMVLSPLGLMLFWKRTGTIVFPTMTEHPIYQVGGIRHMQPTWILPIFMLALILVIERRVLSVWVGRLATGLALLFGLIGLLPAAREVTDVRLALPYPGYVRCFDQAVDDFDLRVGYGDYWIARHLSMLSRRAARVNQVTSELAPRLWVNASTSYLADRGRSYPRYDFVVAAEIPRERIVARFGPPAASRACAGFEVLVYNRSTDIAFRNFIRIPALAANDLPPPSMLAESARHNVWRPDGAPAESALSFGPATFSFEPPAQGDVLELSAEGGATLLVDVENNNGERATLTAAPIAGPGLRARYLPLPPQLSATPIRRLTVRDGDGRGDFHVGHVFLYLDAPPRPHGQALQ